MPPAQKAAAEIGPGEGGATGVATTERAPIVVIIHGIRTDAPWAEMVAYEARRSGIDPRVPRFGYFNVFSFLCPFVTRRGPINRIARALTEICIRHPQTPIHVIAHSFGTYTIANVLLENPEIRIDRLVLCGAVVPLEFPWDRIASQIRGTVINDCGTNDIWPLFANAFTWGFGPTGTIGAGSIDVRDRMHPFQHSEYFRRKYVQDYWITFISTGEIAEPPHVDVPRAPLSRWKWFLLAFAPILRFVPTAILLALACMVFLFLRTIPQVSGTWIESSSGDVITLRQSGRVLSGVFEYTDKSHGDLQGSVDGTGRVELDESGVSGQTGAPFSAKLSGTLSGDAARIDGLVSYRDKKEAGSAAYRFILQRSRDATLSSARRSATSSSLSPAPRPTAAMSNGSVPTSIPFMSCTGIPAWVDCCGCQYLSGHRVVYEGAVYHAKRAFEAVLLCREVWRAQGRLGDPNPSELHDLWEFDGFCSM